jgi:hypothetical protein
MKNYGIGQDKDGAVIPPPLGVYAQNAPPEVVSLPAKEQYDAGVLPLDYYPATWFNALHKYYTQQLLEVAEDIADIYTELLSVLAKADVAPRKAQTAQFVAALQTIIAQETDFVSSKKAEFTKNAATLPLTAGDSLAVLFGKLAKWHDVLTDANASGKAVNFSKTSAFAPLSSGTQLTVLLGVLARWYDEIGAKQNTLNRTVVGNDNATAAVTDAGGALSVPVPVTTVAPAASATQTVASTLSLRAKFKVLVDNIAYLFANKQNNLSRTVVGNDNATAAVTDTGGALSVPIPVTTVAPAASATQTAAGTRSLRAQIKILVDNIAQLFNADAALIQRARKSHAITVGFDSYCDVNVNSYASADLAVQAAVNALPSSSTVILQNGTYVFKGRVTINAHDVTIRGVACHRVYIRHDDAYTGYLFYAAGTSAAYLHFISFENLSFFESDTTKSRSALIYLQYVSYINVYQCMVNDIRSDFLYGYYINNLKVTECWAFNIYGSANGFCYIANGSNLIFAHNNIAWLETYKLCFAQCVEVLITGNNFSNNGIVKFGGSGNARISVTGNVFTHAGLVMPKSCVSDANVTGNTRYGTGETDLSGATVSGNKGF